LDYYIAFAFAFGAYLVVISQVILPYEDIEEVRHAVAVVRNLAILCKAS
jgi:hypothetical protein